MKTQAEGVNVSIMGKEFMVACPDEERDSLVSAANYLDKKMREIQHSGKVLGTERCAIMAALNIANELLDMKRHEGVSVETSQKLRFLQSKIETALER